MAPENQQLTFSAVSLSRNPVNDLRIEQMALWGHRFHELGMVRESEGNLSFSSTLGFVISGTGISLATLAADTVTEVTGVVFGLDRTSVYYKGLATPSSESLMHNAIYEEDESINAIFHVHDNAVMKNAARLGIVTTATEQPSGTLDLANEVVKLLRQNRGLRYFILKNHGVVAIGTSINEAGTLAEEMHLKASR